jgi:P27 family predicted phage terminase small subunit
MAKRGPKPKPQQILRLRGSWRGKKRNTPANIDQNRPRRPIWLKNEAKKCWDDLCPLLFKAGLISELNRHTLALLCCAWEDYVEAHEMLERTRSKAGRALLIKTQGGAVMENPLLYTLKRAYDQLFKAAACFGLTPADINGVRAMDKPPKDEGKGKFFKDIS